MYLAYVYFIRNKITNEFYYGSRCRNIKLKRTPEEDFWVYYFTSSKNIKSLIKEYGKDSFEISIVSKNENYRNCYWYEQDLIKENINDKLCLNQSYHDSSSKSHIFSNAGKIMSQEQKGKISLALKGGSLGPQTPEHNKKCHGPKSQATKDAISKARTGKSRDYHPTEETLDKMSKWQKDIPKEKIISCIYCKKEFTMMNFSMWHGDKCRLSADPIRKAPVMNSLLKNCNHCHNQFNSGNYSRWHGEKCKLR